MVAVAATDLHRRYGDVTALDGVSVSFDAGEIYCLIGPNGAGKTTLVRCLTGTTTPDSGSVEVLGNPPQSVARDRLGLLPQAFRPAPRLTPLELVEYYAGLYATHRDPATVLDDVGIDPRLETWYRDLSGGQQRRVCVATALVNDPAVLVLDEPTTGIDPAGRRDVWALLEELRSAGTAILVTTHDMGEATEIADCVGLLADGEVVASGTPAALIDEYGGVPRLVVETPDTPDVQGFDPVVTENGLLFEGVAATDIGNVVAAVEAGGGRVDAVRWREPDLDDVYLTVTDAAGVEDRP